MSGIIVFMALYIKLDEQRTELQKTLATELQQKAKRRAELADMPDGVEDSRYIEGTKKTTSLAWIWIALVVIVIGIVVWLTVISMAR